MRSNPFSAARVRFLAVLCAVLTATIAAADAPKPVPTRGPATIKELMTMIVEPASNGIFQVGGEPPKTDAQWKTLQGQALTLIEIANSLTLPARAKDKTEWMKNAKAFQDESKKAFAATMAKDVEVLTDLSDSLYTTCANCHERYLPKQ